MTLSEAIAEVKSGRMRTPGPCARTILNAVASGDLIPRTDAEQAVALAYQRAGAVIEADRPDFGDEGICPHEVWEGYACRDCLRDTIFALAPADALAEVLALREALKWYGEQARLCRLIHSEGDAGRQALNDDGGKRARAALGDAG